MGTRKPRKWAGRSTFAVRKEEKSELLTEIKALEQQLRLLIDQADCSASPFPSSDNAQLRAGVRRHQLSLASAQAVVSALLSRGNPLSSPIRLSADLNERHKTLRALRDEKVGNACRYVTARTQQLDPLASHVVDERFETPTGDFCCARFDQVQFDGAPNVRAVYDALRESVLTAEIRVSEQLGTITVRDDFDLVDDNVARYSFHSREFGVPVETHGVLFMQFFESHDVAQGGPCGVIAIDCVDDDALKPYAAASERVRKDVTCMMVLTPHYRDQPAAADGTSERELVVRLSLGRFYKLHCTDACPAATPDAVEGLRATIADWGDVIVASIRDAICQRAWENSGVDNAAMSCLSFATMPQP